MLVLYPRLNWMRSLRVCLAALLASMSCLGSAEVVSEKTFALSLPMMVFGDEGLIRAEFNLFPAASIAVEWVQWMGEKFKREELTPRELKEHPGDSMMSTGKQIGLMVNHYTNQGQMSGYNWGVGAGYRVVTAQWHQRVRDNTPSFYAANADNEGFINHELDVTGATLSGRVGYRLVGETLGIMGGAYLGFKHFQNNVKDSPRLREEGSTLTPISRADAIAIQERMENRLQIGFEFGWAF